MGYANTDYTRRLSTVVERDVRHYKSWYNVTDIFLDEVSSDASGLPYYRRLAGYIHGTNPGSTVMLNPGAYPDQQYMSVGDVVMVYENTYASYVRLHVPAWVEETRPRNSCTRCTPPRSHSWRTRSACPSAGTPVISMSPATAG